MILEIILTLIGLFLGAIIFGALLNFFYFNLH
jgi:hypothetical protein